MMGIMVTSLSAIIYYYKMVPKSIQLKVSSSVAGRELKDENSLTIPNGQLTADNQQEKRAAFCRPQKSADLIEYQVSRIEHLATKT
jgi:hypothetical protein